MLHFVDTEYYRGIESRLEGLKMASMGIVVMLYIIDYQNDERFGELGRGIANSMKCITVWLCGVREFEALHFQIAQSQFVYSYFLFLR